MEIRYPNYYKKFQCIAGACPDTCCAGWKISVDQDSEKRYLDVRRKGQMKNKAFAKKLKRHIRHGRIISEGETCPFLNDDGLCEMYLELGPESLCHTCARHPRHLEDYGNLHEIVLLLSCPEVARLVLQENEGGFYTRNLPDRQGNMDGIDEELLALLLEVRRQIWEWTADPDMRWEDCLMCSVALAHDVQRRLADMDYKAARETLKRYGSERIAELFVKQWNQKKKNQRSGSDRFLLMTDLMSALADLETICRDWPKMLKQCRETQFLSADSQKLYEEKRSTLAETIPEVEQDARKVYEYWIYSLVLAALYDGDLLTKVKMAVLCTMAVEELYLATKGNLVLQNDSIMNDEKLRLDTRVQICHALARQIENSDENRSILERTLKQETFSAHRIIDALVSLPQNCHDKNM